MDVCPQPCLSVACFFYRQQVTPHSCSSSVFRHRWHAMPAHGHGAVKWFLQPCTYSQCVWGSLCLSLSLLQATLRFSELLPTFVASNSATVVLLPGVFFESRTAVECTGAVCNLHHFLAWFPHILLVDVSDLSCSRRQEGACAAQKQTGRNFGPWFLWRETGGCLCVWCWAWRRGLGRTKLRRQ